MFSYATRERLLSLLVLMAWASAVRGDIVSYNASSQELTLKCPGQPVKDADVLFIKLVRQHDDMLLANWSTHNNEGHVTYDRAILRRATPPTRLEVVLSHVTCYDEATYTCKMAVNNHEGPTSEVMQNQTFFFGGEIRDPVLKVEPSLARYTVGDSIRLTCSAHIGTPNNTIVWESRLPGGNFSLVTGTCDRRTNITDHEPKAGKSKSCGVTFVSSLTRELTSHDDGREWRCRLKNSHHQAVLPVAVQCKDGTEPCRHFTGGSEERSRSSGSEANSSRNPLRVSAVRGGQSDTSAESPQTLIILIAVICVLFVTMVISIVIMVVMIRRQTKKSLGPLIITPEPSDYNYGPLPRPRTRSLPQLPAGLEHLIPDHLNPDAGRHHHHHHHHLNGNGFIGRGIGGGGIGGGGGGGIDGPATSSVYVSMSALPSLHENPKADHDPPGMENGERVLLDFRRSESVYSNDGHEGSRCCTQSTKVSTGGSSVTESCPDSHSTTMGNLKGWM